MSIVMASDWSRLSKRMARMKNIITATNPISQYCVPSSSYEPYVLSRQQKPTGNMALYLSVIPFT